MGKVFTLPALAREIGIGYAVVYDLRQRGHLRPYMKSGAREYFTVQCFQDAAARSLEQKRYPTKQRIQTNTSAINYREIL